MHSKSQSTDSKMEIIQSINGRITIAKTILLPQYTLYVGSVLDNVSQNQYKNIQKVLDHYILYNSYCEQNKKSKKWIDDELLYGDKSKGGYGHIRVTDLFYSIKTSWIKRYATQIIDDHWCDLLDVKLGLTPTTRRNLYKGGAEKFDPIINE